MNPYEVAAATLSLKAQTEKLTEAPSPDLTVAQRRAQYQNIPLVFAKPSEAAPAAVPAAPSAAASNPAIADSLPLPPTSNLSNNPAPQPLQPSPTQALPIAQSNAPSPTPPAPAAQATAPTVPPTSAPAAPTPTDPPPPPAQQAPFVAAALGTPPPPAADPVPQPIAPADAGVAARMPGEAPGTVY